MSSEIALIEIIFNRQYPVNDPTKRERLKIEITKALAQILQTEPSNITVVSMAPGSVRTILKVLPPFANVLIDLAEKRDPILQENGIERVKPFNPQIVGTRDFSDEGTFLTGPDVVARIVPHYQLSDGLIRRFVDIPDGHQGLILRNGIPTNKLLLPGKQVVAGFGDALWMQPALIEAVLVRTTPIVIPLLLQNVIDASGEQWGIWAPIELQITDAKRFVSNLALQSNLVSASDLLIALLEKIQPGLLAAIRAISINRKSPTSAIETIKHLLDDLLPQVGRTNGISIKPVDRLNVWPLDTAIIHAKSILKLKNELVQVYIDASIDRAEQYAVMHDIVSNMAMDYDLPQDILVDVLSEVSDFSLSTEQILAAYIEMLDTIASINVSVKLNQLRPGNSSRKVVAPAMPPEQVNLMHWSKILKLGATILFLIIAIFNFFIAPIAFSTKATNILPLLAELPISVAMFLMAFRLDNRAGESRERWYANHRLTGWSDQTLQDTDQSVRRQIVNVLTTVKNHLVDARKTLYAANHTDAALHLQQLIKTTVEPLIVGVQQPDRGVPRYLSVPPPDTVQLETELDYDTSLLAIGTSLVNLSETFLQDVTGNATDAEAGIIEIKNMITHLSTTFDNRSQAIK